MRKKKIAVIGGSFNPVHNGHIAIGEAVKRSLMPDKILFVPSFIHPDKGKAKGASPEDRMNMLKIAIEDREDWETSDIEYRRDETSYTVDTIRRLKTIYGEDKEIFFVCGADIMYTIHTWRDPLGLFGLCNFAVVQRPGYITDDFLSQVEAVKEKYKGQIEVIECKQVDVSSSEIRDSICNGKSVKDLVPDRVEEYIKNNGLYEDS